MWNICLNGILLSLISTVMVVTRSNKKLHTLIFLKYVYMDKKPRRDIATFYLMVKTPSL